ncbi:MAG: hypothetical protein ACXVDA_17195, partial [Ktedonobacterales bacterium]
AMGELAHLAGFGLIEGWASGKMLRHGTPPCLPPSARSRPALRNDALGYTRHNTQRLTAVPHRCAVAVAASEVDFGSGGSHHEAKAVAYYQNTNPVGIRHTITKEHTDS